MVRLADEWYDKQDKLDQKLRDQGMSEQSIQNMRKNAEKKAFNKLYENDYQDFSDEEPEIQEKEAEGPVEGDTFDEDAEGNSKQTTPVPSEADIEQQAREQQAAQNIVKRPHKNTFTEQAASVGGIGGAVAGALGLPISAYQNHKEKKLKNKAHEVLNQDTKSDEEVVNNAVKRPKGE